MSRAGASASHLAVWVDDGWKWLSLSSHMQFHDSPLQCLHCSEPASEIECDPVVTRMLLLPCEFLQQIH